jgi:hypothetical protein
VKVLKENFMNNLRIIAALILTLGCGMSINAWSAQAGLVQFVSGSVEIIPVSGATHALHKGDAVSEGDTVVSAKTASAQIKMADGGFIAVRPDTQLKFDSFKFGGKKDEPESAFFSLIKGGFRAITGLIGSVKKDDYHITTPAATIGIRGTDQETVVVLPNNPLVLAGLAVPGTYNRVNVGATIITTERGFVIVSPNQMGFAGGQNQQPKIQPVNLNLFTAAPPPSPGAKMDNGNKGENGDQGASGAGSDSGNGGGQGMRSTSAGDSAPQSPPANNTSGSVSVSGTTTLPGIAPPSVIPNLDNLITTVVSAAITNPYWAVGLVLQGDTASTSQVTSAFSTLPANISLSSTSPSVTVSWSGNGCQYPPCQNGATYALTGAVVVSAETGSVAATGIKFGRYTVTGVTTTYTYTDNTTSTNSQTLTNGAASWITGPGINPFYLPEALLGTATYVLNGGTSPITQTGATGTLTSASLSVNFTNQTVDAALAGNAGGHTWTAAANGMVLSSGSGTGNARSAFSASGVTATMDGNGVGANSYISGQLTGSAINGALLQYYLSDGASNSVSGVAALELSTVNEVATTSMNTATSYQLVALSRYVAGGVTQNGVTQNYDTNGTFNNSSSVSKDGSGNVVSFNMSGNNNNGTATNANSIAIGTAVATDMGTDSVSGISWGRWAGGSYTMTNLATMVATQVDNTSSSLHWLSAPVMTGPVSLPVTGTYTYTWAGGTSPTDNLGNVGTLNSATLQANFTAMTVNAGVNATVNSVNYVATGTGLPIQQAIFGNNNGGGTFTATANGTTINGSLGGAFTGAGATGAGMVYSFQDGSTVVNGVAAFHR